ncbi:MAG: type I addiction module toxin, SymE family [Gammaproteobacteria bacterium]|nr:type I addiction module toxin, SymE family [Gammaproteobacteria bacterium]
MISQSPARLKQNYPTPAVLKSIQGITATDSTSNPSGYRKPIPVPWIQLKGYWLDQAGFTVGIELEIKISQQRMVITPASSGCTT